MREVSLGDHGVPALMSQQPGAPVACLPKVIDLTIVGKHVLFVEGGKLK